MDRITDFLDTDQGAFIVGAGVGVMAFLTIVAVCMVIWPESILSIVGL